MEAFMGACYQSRVLIAETEAAAKAEFQRLKADLRRQFGADPNNGTLSNCELGHTIPNIFDDRAKADRAYGRGMRRRR